MGKHETLESRFFAGGRSSAGRPRGSPSHLLVIDCETQRFTIEGPIAADCLNVWYTEADHALMAGRIIFCVPISDLDMGEIAALGTELGYDRWPSGTIIALPKKWNEAFHDRPSAVAERGVAGRAELLSRNRSAWLQGLRRKPERQAKAS